MTRTAHGAGVWLPILAVAALIIGGCGGGSSHKSTTTTAKTTSTTAKTTTASGPAVKVPTTVTETIHGPTPGGTWQSTFTAKPGDKLVFRTTIPGKATSPAMQVKLAYAKGPGKALTLIATGGGHTSKAVIKSASGKPLTLLGLHFRCTLPPQPSYCPPHHVTTDKAGYHFTFKSTHTAAIVIGGEIGPTKTAFLSAKPIGRSVVPAYAMKETVRLVTKTRPKNPAPPTSALSAKSGDIIVARTRLTGTLTGAPQTVTVVLEQGPAKKLAITALIPGGQKAIGTISSASGSPIELVLPHYTCYAPPLQTFCPAKSIQAGSHRYTLKFSASPASAPIDIIATVQAG